MVDILNYFSHIIYDSSFRRNYLLRKKKYYKGLIGIFSNYIPVEILDACEFFPVRIIGQFKKNNYIKSLSLQPICSFINDVYKSIISGEFNFYDNLILPNTCDSIKSLSMNIELEFKNIIFLFNPIQVNNYGLKYFSKELKRMINLLHNKFINPDQLVTSIIKYNNTRKLLKQLLQKRSKDPFCLSASNLLDIFTAGLILDKEEYNNYLKKIIESLKLEEKNATLKNILIYSSIMDNSNLISKIEEFKVNVIDLSITNGSKFLMEEVDINGDVWTNLLYNYLAGINSPIIYNPKNNSEFFLKRIKDLNINGVLFIIQKYCDPYLFDYIQKEKLLINNGIRAMLLEVNHDSIDLNEHILLRLESFIESI